jgi:hypothetical protein
MAVPQTHLASGTSPQPSMEASQTITPLKVPQKQCTPESEEIAIDEFVCFPV